jgi:uncharacterized protein
MPHIEGHAAGNFCWFELGTSDQTAAANFYSALFGWEVNTNPMGPGFTYTIFRLEGRDCGAAYTLMPDQVQQGIPPNWMVYVAVDSTDETASKTTALGGKVIAPPMDVMDFGRMAVLQDPTGATFSVWQAKSHKGATIAGVPGTFCWGELSTPQPEKATPFYTELFGWKMMASENPADKYLHIMAGTQAIGGVAPVEHRDPNAPPNWMSYFLVTSCDASANKAVEMGAKVLFGPVTMEKVGRFAFVADPQGAMFALFEPMPHQ